MKQDLSLYMPAYQVEQWLTETVQRIPAEIYPRIRCLHVINDGSTDQTAAIAGHLAQRYAWIQVHHFERNRGYGAVVHFGLQQCLKDDSRFAICLHGDGQYAPESLPQMLKALEDRLDLVQGSRHAAGTALQGGMPVYKWLAGKALCHLEGLVLGLFLSDFHSGFLGFRTAMLRQLPLQKIKGRFEIDLKLIALAHRQHYQVGEIPIPTRYAGEISYLNPFTYGLRVLGFLRNYRRGVYG